MSSYEQPQQESRDNDDALLTKALRLAQQPYTHDSSHPLLIMISLIERTTPQKARNLVNEILHKCQHDNITLDHTLHDHLKQLAKHL